MTRTEELRAAAKAKWPDQKGLYCYVQNGEYEVAFASGVFPRTVALQRQAAYRQSVAEKFAEVNGDPQPTQPSTQVSQVSQPEVKLEEITSMSYTPPAGFSHRKKPRTCQYCQAAPVYWFECPDGKYRLFRADGRPCNPACHHHIGQAQRAHQPEPEELESDPYEEISQAAPELVPPITATKTRAQLIAELLDQPQQLDETQIRAIIRQELSRENRVTVDMQVKINDLPIVDCKDQHEQFPILITLFAARIPLMLVGPAGSGKTTACHKAAEKLGLSFRFIACGGQTSESRFVGYMDAKGDYVQTPLRESYENGGVFLFDEIDAAQPAVLVVLNSILANSCMTFPDGCTVQRHEDFIPVAAANTFGQGADRQYVGRQQIDGATLDRFFLLEWQYDWAFTRILAGIPTPHKQRALAKSGYTPVQWADKVQRMEKYCRERNIRQIVGPRALLYGIKLLEALPRDLLEEGLLWRGMNSGQRAQIEGGIQ